MPETFIHHGSAIPSLTELKPLSRLHNTEKNVVYLSSSMPYVLLYIWDSEKTRYSRKYVTSWLKDGVANYEEQFPGQLKAFYEGVRGYVYSVEQSSDMHFVQQREGMFYSELPVNVCRVTEIPDVHQELLRYEREGLFRVFRYEDATAEKQTELAERIASFIARDGMIDRDDEQSRFMKRYFADAWEKAKEITE